VEGARMAGGADGRGQKCPEFLKDMN